MGPSGRSRAAEDACEGKSNTWSLGRAGEQVITGVRQEIVRLEGCGEQRGAGGPLGSTLTDTLPRNQEGFWH